MPHVHKLLSPDEQTSLIEHIAAGKSANSWVKETGIHRQRVYYNLEKDPEFLRRYQIAREYQADTFQDHQISIAERLQDNSDEGTMDANKGRVASDIYDRVARNLYPKKYGAQVKIDVEHTHKLSMADYLLKHARTTAIDVDAEAIDVD